MRTAVYKEITELTGTTMTAFFFGGLSFGFIGNDFILLMFHVSFYSISYYIRLLSDQMVNNSSKTHQLPWKDSKQILQRLYEASEALSSVFSIPALFIIASKLVISSIFLFSIIYALVQPTLLLSSIQVLLFLVQISCSFARVLVVLHAADMPIYQVKQVIIKRN